MMWEKWCQYNTKLERLLIFFVILLFFIVLVLFIIVLSSAHVVEVCNDPECVRAATHILDTIDPSVDPCDNFYNFACGSFLKNAFSLGQPTTMHYLKELMKNKLKEIVMETTHERNLSRTLVMQRKFYRACINETAIEEDNDQTFLRLLDVLVNGWPIVKADSWSDREFEWAKTMVKARKLGLFYEFFFRVGIYYYSEDNSTSHHQVLWIKPPYESYISSLYWKDQNIDIMKEIALDWGAHSVSVIELRRTMYFAEQLDQIVKKYYNNTTTHEPDTTQMVALKDLEHKYFKVNWFDLLENITGFSLNKNDLVVFDAEDYFTDLYYLLQLRTPKRTQANYMAWATISKNINYMTKKIRDKYERIQKNSNGTTENLSRSDLCYKISRDLFKNVAEGEYIRRYTPPDKREYIKDIIKNVKEEVKVSLQKNSWMDKTTKDYAIKHLKNTTESIGWTDIVYDVKKFEKLFGYHHLKLTSDKPVNIARTVTNNVANHYYKELQEVRDKDEEYLNTPKLSVNAYYVLHMNILILPTSILQGQILNENRPHYMNYGALGSIIGHEFTHGYMESSLVTYPSEIWWTNTTSRNFKKVTQCLVDEYNLYPEKLTGFSKNGSMFEENLADFSGVNFAYRAYQNWVSKNGHENSLPGIKYTPNQLFWIMASTYLCYGPRLEEKNEATTNVLKKHGVPSFRVIGPLRNSPYFAHDFNCPVGSSMNPKNKCRIFT